MAHGRYDILVLGLLIGILLRHVTEQKGREVATANHNEHHEYRHGIAWSAVAIFGNAATGAMRKRLSSLDAQVGHAEQVGMTALLQGLIALAVLQRSGSLKAPTASFWIAAAMSSLLNALIKTMETCSTILLCLMFLL